MAGKNGGAHEVIARKTWHMSMIGSRCQRRTAKPPTGSGRGRRDRSASGPTVTLAPAEMLVAIAALVGLQRQARPQRLPGQPVRQL
jgi:hypothetical protein